MLRGGAGALNDFGGGSGSPIIDKHGERIEPDGRGGATRTVVSLDNYIEDSGGGTDFEGFGFGSSAYFGPSVFATGSFDGT